jgi:hypothetical protein
MSTGMRGIDEIWPILLQKAAISRYVFDYARAKGGQVRVR